MKISVILSAAVATAGLSGGALAQENVHRTVTVVKHTTVVRHRSEPVRVVHRRVVRHRVVRHRVVRVRVVHHPVVRHRVVRTTVRHPADQVRSKTVVVKTRTVTH
jgi:hypothetical protein